MKNNGKENKIQLRKEFAARRDAIPPSIRAEKSRKILNRLFDQDYYREAQVIFSFLPFRSEVDVRPIFEDAWKKGKITLVPRIDYNRNEMEAVPIASFENLKKGRMNLLEPDESIAAYDDLIDLVITPGLAFDNEGYRLGYGGGYYDRFFTRHPFKNSVGVAFEVQRTPRLPRGAFDVPVDYLITEKKIRSFSNEKNAENGT